MVSLNRSALAAAMLGLFALTSSATAEQIPALCSKQPNQAAMTRCADDFLKKANAEMAKTLKELLAATDKDNHTFITEAQDAWET